MLGCGAPQPLCHCLNVLTESVQESENNNIFFYVLVIYRAQRRLEIFCHNILCDCLCKYKIFF